MIDKKIEKRRVAYVRREFRNLLEAFGFERQPSGGYTRRYGSHMGQVWLQKLSVPFLFRVAMSFQADGSIKPIVEFADKYTFRNPPGGRKYNFRFRFGDLAEERCVSEIRDFVADVALPWLEQQARIANQSTPGSSA